MAANLPGGRTGRRLSHRQPALPQARRQEGGGGDCECAAEIEYARRVIQSSSAAAWLPEDHRAAMLIGRVWLPEADGPAVVAVIEGELRDVSRLAPTCSQLCELDDPAAAVRAA